MISKKMISAMLITSQYLFGMEKCHHGNQFGNSSWYQYRTNFWRSFFRFGNLSMEILILENYVFTRKKYLILRDPEKTGISQRPSLLNSTYQKTFWGQERFTYMLEKNRQWFGYRTCRSMGTPRHDSMWKTYNYRNFDQF